MPKQRRRPIIRRGPMPFRYVFILTFILFIISTVVGLEVINVGIKPTLMNYAEAKTKEIATLVINKAVNQRVVEQEAFNVDDIITIRYDENQTVSNLILDAAIVNRVSAEITNLVLTYMNEAENGDLEKLKLPSDIEVETANDKPAARGLEYAVPLGQATNNALLGNLGPRVPIRFLTVGNVSSDILPKIEEYGVNNAFITILVHIEVNVQIIVPFATEVTTVTTDVPVAMGIINGKVPNVYIRGGEDMPSIEVPID
ncbi:sporulation protein YunB [Bacillus sp. HMF5848]|uniref:sporulation protein YunB n=1 Tax=Bacillus sp. HMF5848 TaxID=2495421 RepID=UPI000F779B72|nr:sporulation protein YunB [Bacillus sp. HMF5848]RSK28447.1 sporulation protein YunB [Bacillus sp. HMF5848]